MRRAPELMSLLHSRKLRTARSVERLGEADRREREREAGGFTSRGAGSAEDSP